MQLKTIISQQPKCITCGNPIFEWDAFAEEHEHIHCVEKRIANNFIILLKNQLNLKS